MKISPIDLINTMHGKLYDHAAFYFRRSPSGRIYACKCPDRSRHIKTPAERANQQQFAARYAGSHRHV